MASCKDKYQQGIHSLKGSFWSNKPESKVFYVVNLVVLLGKQFISICKKNKKLILFTVYLDLIKVTLVVMEQNANVKDEKESFIENLVYKNVQYVTQLLQYRQLYNISLFSYVLVNL